MFLRLLFVLLFFCSLSLAAQTPQCFITAANANQDLCTACSTGGNDAIVDGRFEGDLILNVSYTIDANCLNSITWGGTVYIYLEQFVNLTFAAEPRVESVIDVITATPHQNKAGTIRAYGTEYFATKSNGNDGRFFNFEAQMEATAGTFRSDLPIELVDWRAKRDGNQVTLSWTTAREQDNDYFEVAYSPDGMVFTPVATVAGAGTTDREQHYTVTHRPTATGTAYYRLRQVDLDGTATVAEALAVSASSTAQLSVYPNPAPAGTLLTIAGTSAVSTVGLYDLRGQVVRTDEGTGTSFVLPQDLAPGTYLLRVGTVTTRVVVR